MAGGATLGTNLIDALGVPLADALRSSLNSAFGIRQWHAFTVRRRWAGGQRGEGVVSVIEKIALLPDPEVLFEGQGAFHYAMREHGREAVGDAMLREVSLTFTEAQLTGGTIADSDDFFVKLEDAQGQGLAPRFFVATRPPTADRVKRIGWEVMLGAVEITQPGIS